MDRVVGKVALVSGAASGIGAACARLLAAEGASVMLVDLNDNLDVVDEAAWITLMAEIKSRFGGLNIAVNCAGTSVSELTFPTQTTLDEWQRVNRINLDGTFLATKHELALMMETSPVNGSIVNISSVLGITGQPGIAAYKAS